jgi:hypothetical protein
MPEFYFRLPAIAMPLAYAFARLSPQSPDLLVRSGISSLTQGNSYLLSTNLHPSWAVEWKLAIEMTIASDSN